MSMAYAQMSTSGEVGVDGGGLSVNSASALEAFGSVDVATVDQYIEDYVFGNSVEFEDTRDSGAAYTLSVYASDFADGYTITVDNFSMGADSINDVSGGIHDCSTGFTLAPVTTFVDSDLDGVSDPQALVDTDGTQDTITHCEVYPVVDLTIPAYTPIGGYQSTITFTFI
ncbi:hypothetical protein HN680_01485 [Candidatus Peregrinibacteria bacterium]|nr:hypothetical protein [Candidatus Peregrinibacteria bacterium]